MEHRGVRGTVRDGASGSASGGAGRGRASGGAGWAAAVAAGCAVAVLVTSPSWALRRPEPRPAVEVVAPGAPAASVLPAVADASTLPAPVGASTLPAPVGASTLPAPVGASTLPAPALAGPSTLPALAAVPSDSDLVVVRIDPDPAAPGLTTTVHAFVANRGPDTTASPFTVVVTLPKGVTAEGPFFPQECRVLEHGRQVRCVFGPGLPPLRSATALVPVRLSPELPVGTLHGGSVAVHGADDQREDGNRQPFDITVVATAAGS